MALTIQEAGGTVDRRVLSRVKQGVLGGLLNAQAAVAALRRSSPDVSPHVPTLIAAELPILAVEVRWPRWRRSPWWGRSACRGGCRSSASP